MDESIRFLGVGAAEWTTAAIACAAKASAVLACAGVLAFVLRKRAASTRHLAWTLGVTGALAVIPSSVTLPRWGLPVLTTQERISAEAEARPSISSPPEPPTTSSTASGVVRLREPAEVPASPSRAIRPRPAFALGAWPLAVWLAGTIAVLAWCAVGWCNVRRIGRKAERITDLPWTDAASEAAGRLGMTWRATLLRGGPAVMPITWGTIRPVILLPAEADEWPPDRRRAVLMHELAHVRRRDGLTQWLALAACAAYWFNPLAWWAAARLRSEREQACDDLVLEAGERPSDYAEQLLSVARSLRPTPSMAPTAMAMARPSGLEGRLLAILDPRRLRRGPARWLAAACLVVALGASATLAAVQLVAREVPHPVIAGQIVGVDGRPAEGVDVVVLKHRPPPGIFYVDAALTRLLGRSRTDARGEFRIVLEAEESQAEDSFKLIATTPGASFFAHDLSNLKNPTVEPIRLTPEQPLVVRLLDLEGAPIAGAKVRLKNAYHLKSGGGLSSQWLTEDAIPTLAGERTTDSDGLLNINGLGPDLSLYLEASAAGFGSQVLRLETKAGVDAATLAMGRAHVVEGRVTLGEEGPPAVGAKVEAQSMSSSYGIGQTMGTARVSTDAEGRYRFEAAPGASIKIEVRGQSEGTEAYLLRTRLIVPGDSVSSREDFILPRGVLVRGRVTDADTGEPIAGAAVWHRAHERKNPYFIEDATARMSGEEQKGVTAADGSFQLAVIPGPGYLLVRSPTSDYLHEVISSVDLYGHLTWPNARHYPGAFKRIEPKPGEGPFDVMFTLRRGTTVTGRLVGADGQPVQESVLFSRWYLGKRDITVNHGQALLPLREGRFEMKGCDPAGSAPVFFLDAANQRGAMIEISGKQAGQDMDVVFQPCGTASVRLVGPDGKPVRPGLNPSNLEIILTPGASFASVGMKQDESPLISDTIHVANLDRDRYRKLEVDTDGRVTYPTLIPGAAYRITVYNQPVKTEVEFSVKPGEAKDLGDLVIPKLDQAR